MKQQSGRCKHVTEEAVKRLFGSNLVLVGCFWTEFARRDTIRCCEMLFELHLDAECLFICGIVVAYRSRFFSIRFSCPGPTDYNFSGMLLYSLV